MIKMFLKRHWVTLTGVLTGALGGFLYWYFIGCSSGSCPITSSPVNSALWGAVLGGLLFNAFERDVPKEK
ncbi:MAG: DUF6132 family protein [Bacteroidales bacterium]|nr:DUF6132 family protein [Bacteroidales bacterium]